MWVCQRGKRWLSQEPSNSMYSQTTGPPPPPLWRCCRRDELAVVCDAEVGMMVTSAAAKLYAGAGHYPQLSGSLCILALPRDPWSKANSSGRACSNIQQASTTWGTPRTSQWWLSYPSLSPVQLSKWVPISLSLCPLLSGKGTGTRGQPTMRGGAKTKVEHRGTVWPRRGREFILAAPGAMDYPHN